MAPMGNNNDYMKWHQWGTIWLYEMALNGNNIDYIIWNGTSIGQLRPYEMAPIRNNNDYMKWHQYATVMIIWNGANEE